jgi:Flp pilus assembly pilin Flp
MKNLFNRFVREEAGQDIIEYALLAAFISIVAWGVLVTIGQDVSSIYNSTEAATADAKAKAASAGS